MMENDTGWVALNWSPTLYFSIAPTRLPSRLLSDFESLSSLPQPASDRAAMPAAPAVPASICRLLKLDTMGLLPGWFNGASAGGCLALDGAERDAGDEVTLNERIDEHDRQHRQHDRHGLDVGRDLQRAFA